MSAEGPVLNVQENKSKSDVLGDVCHIFGVFFAIGVRLVLFMFSIFTAWLVTFRLEDTKYWLLSILTIFMIIEAVNIVVYHAGQERKWVCLCFICFLISCVPSIWILELDRLDTYQSKTSNISEVTVSVSGVSAELKLDPSITLQITEQALLFLIILCRWLLPRGDISRNQLSQLLFVFIGMASDVMELFELFDESDVREDRTLTFVILSVWTVSLFQFSFVLTMVSNPKKKRVALNNDETTSREKSGFLGAVFKTELWSLLISITMQDGPFLSVRLYTIVTYNLITYSIIFFTCKNMLVIMLLFYRLLILLLEKYEGNEDDDDDYDDNNKSITVTGAGTPPLATKKPRHGNQVHPENGLENEQPPLENNQYDSSLDQPDKSGLKSRENATPEV